MRPTPGLFLLCTLAIGCEDSGNEVVVGPAAMIEKASYVLGEPITITVANEMDPTIYVMKCCDRLVFHIDLLSATGTWTQYGTSDIPCLNECSEDGGPLPLSYFSVPVLPSSSYQQSVDSGIRDRGTFRFRLLYRFVDTNRGLDSEELTSNSFKIE